MGRKRWRKAVVTSELAHRDGRGCKIRHNEQLGVEEDRLKVA